MGHKVKVNGTVYEAKGGKTKVNGTAYSIKGGKTKVNGTGYSINFFPPPSSHTPGDIITWDNKSWLVCHYDSSNNRVYLIASDTVENNINFGSNNQYAGSALATRCVTYQNNSMSATALDMCVDVTVNGVTAKVFVPSYEQMNGGFSWFNSNEHRSIIRFDTGYSYWTSSAYGSLFVWYVSGTGRLTSDYAHSGLQGFRPCVCVQL